jgi:hypothetical protein
LIPDIKNAAFTGAVMLSVLSLLSFNPAVSFTINQLLGIVSSLGIIIHFVIIDLAYPLRMQIFFADLFPLITFDIIPTDVLYDMLFGTSTI